MSFVWDALKAKANLQKHGVSFQEAAGVFGDPLALVVDDTIHSEQEPREIIIGCSRNGTLLFVCFTEQDENVRLISAREATRRERKSYEDDNRF